MDPQRLIRSSPHEAEHPSEASLRETYRLFRDRLKPPFSLSIPSPHEYAQLNLALAYATLAQPELATTHLTHLHALVTDGYALFTTALLNLSTHSFSSLLHSSRSQLLWVTSKLVQVSAVKADSLVISLLRQINGGDFSEPNLSLCFELLTIFAENWDWLLDEPLVLTSALYVFLRLLADHYRLVGDKNMDSLKSMEIGFCVKALRQYFKLCLGIGRDLVRLLLDLVSIPEIKELWKDLLFNPSKFGVAGFSDIAQIYSTRTPAHYFLLRISPAIETQLRFLLTHVKWGSQKRYQTWFSKKHLSLPGSETVITDIVRFICCAHHPSNEIIQSNVISRWAVIGWLLKCCRRNYFEANAKLALFYDWLFFDEKVDNIMNIEPAMLLMVNSIPKYVDMTQMLLEFLLLLVDNFDVQRRETIVRGVSASFGLLVRKRVVNSLEPLTACSLLSPLLRERLSSLAPRSTLQSCTHSGASEEGKVAGPDVKTSSMHVEMSR